MSDEEIDETIRLLIDKYGGSEIMLGTLDTEITMRVTEERFDKEDNDGEHDSE